MEQDRSLEQGARSYGFRLFAICAGWFLLWTLLPCLLLENAYIDVLENIVWGSHFQFGYDKNPYFIPWLTWAGYKLAGEGVRFSYVFSQISVALCLFCVWRIAKSFLPPVHAFVSVLFLLGVLFFGIKTLEFNDDVAEISLWGLTMLFFHRALVKRSSIDWLLVGVFSGLAFMTKYYGAVLFLPMLLIMLWTEEGRRSFKAPGVYLAGLAFLALSLPNVVWLVNNDFVAIRYAFGRANLSGGGSSFMNHIYEPFDFLKGLSSAAAASFIAFFVVFHKRDASMAKAPSFERKFVGALALGPSLCTFLFSLATGGSIKYSWMTPGLSLLGLFLVTEWRPLITSARLKLFLAFVAVFALVCSLVFAFDMLYKQPYLKKKCAYENFPGDKVADSLTALWHERYGVKVRYVVANREEACNFSVYSEDHPEAYFSANKSFSQWIDVKDLLREGAVVLWKGTLDNEPSWIKSLEADSVVSDYGSTMVFPRSTKGWFRALLGLGEPKQEPVSFRFVKPASKPKP